ncbi:MAG TPA: hypothetical protein VFX98_05285 [Longimicrobiaceae bacterium]|nr:hypothetical protein [Longimicrobiaceae bacterium]
MHDHIVHPPPADDDRPWCKPRPATLAELEFEPRPMVHWFDPGQLVQTILRSLLAGVFGTYADKRELQEALSHGKAEDFDYSRHPGGEIWIDYVADVAEGFGSTYTIAWLLAQQQLPLPGAPDAPVAADALPDDRRPGETVAPRGRILVMGGDQVYPTASADEYENRMAGPYDAALPCLGDAREECPHLYVIPGNHDWYDGLTAFLRQFCQGRSIGAWKTKQHRSYWSVKLPHGWWLWGTDIQLDADIDAPQLEYFRRAAREASPGDRVILCTAEPCWVPAGRDALRRREGGDDTLGSQGEFDNLEFFERTIIRKHGLVLAVTITGDAHHYTRYSYAAEPGAPESVHKITAGGGAAHMTPTHHLPDRLPLTFTPVRDDVREAPTTLDLERRVEFPTQAESREFLAGLPALRERNPGMGKLLAGMYAVLFFIFHLSLVGWRSNHRILESLSGVLLLDGLLLSVLVMGATRALAHLSPGAKPDALKRLSWAHGAAHLLIVAVTAAVLAFASVAAVQGALGFERGDDYSQPWLLAGYLGVAAVLTVAMSFVGKYLGTWVMAGYLRVADRLEVNSNEAYASMAIEDRKNFLRMRLTEAGLTIYPYGVREVVRTEAWKPDPDGPRGAPLLKPEQAPRIHLIEQPVFVPRTVRPPYDGEEESRLRVMAVFGEAGEEAETGTLG